MKIIHNPRRFQREMEKLRRRGRTIGFVPTMGALHEGHLSLVRKARRENRVVAVSIFVNPLQFGHREDFTRYPRKIDRDASLLKKQKVDYLFLPDSRSFYPPGYQTYVEVTDLSRPLCGRFRPGHFRGVTTVVSKLFNLVQPHRAYFGAKDYQQAVIIQQLVKDLNWNIEIKILPSVRERNQLALSSRNAALSIGERERALSISKALSWAESEIKKGRGNVSSVRSGIRQRLRGKLKRIDYVEIVQANDLQPVKSFQGKVLIAVAGWVGKTRLIDNVIIPRKGR